MPPIGEKLTQRPEITPEQQELIKNRELEIGKRINAMAPPIHDYLVYPLIYSTEDLTITMSGSATYPVGDKIVSAFVTRNINNDVHLQTRLYSTDSDKPFPESGQSMLGDGVKVSNGDYSDGTLGYMEKDYPLQLTTFEQHIDALDNIEETLELIAAANLATYGVESFEGLDGEALIAIRNRAEPGLADFAWQSFEQYLADKNR
jgi:hypothetical protein